MEIGGEKVEKTGSMQCFDVSEIFFLNSNMYFLILHVLVCLQNVLKFCFVQKVETQKILLYSFNLNFRTCQFLCETVISFNSCFQFKGVKYSE